MVFLRAPRSIVFFLLLLALLVSVPASAQTIYQPDFSDVSDFNVVPPSDTNPPPIVVGGELRLTEPVVYMRGGIWKIDKIDVSNGFSTTFSFRIEQPAQQPGSCPLENGGDGIAFVVQNHNNTRMGSFGVGMGYGSGEGPSGIQSSVAVEFDTWQNTNESVDEEPVNDPSDNHVSVQSRGALANYPTASASLGLQTVAGVDFNDGQTHTGGISYLPGGALIVSVDGSQVLSVPNFDLADFASQDETGMAWVGFTSATGACFQTHILEDWLLFRGLFDNGFEQASFDVWSSVAQ